MNHMDGQAFVSRTLFITVLYTLLRWNPSFSVKISPDEFFSDHPQNHPVGPTI